LSHPEWKQLFFHRLILKFAWNKSLKSEDFFYRVKRKEMDFVW